MLQLAGMKTVLAIFSRKTETGLQLVAHLLTQNSSLSLPNFISLPEWTGALEPLKKSSLIFSALNLLFFILFAEILELFR